MSAFGRLPFPVALGLLAAISLGGVAGLYWLSWGRWSLLAVVVAGVLAVAYLYEYQRDAPPAPPSSAPAAAPEEDPEPFEDPVEEAARLDQAAATAPAEGAPDVPAVTPPSAPEEPPTTPSP